MTSFIQTCCCVLYFVSKVYVAIVFNDKLKLKFLPPSVCVCGGSTSMDGFGYVSVCFCFCLLARHQNEQR